jgi:hypothetical protein
MARLSKIIVLGEIIGVKIEKLMLLRTIGYL